MKNSLALFIVESSRLRVVLNKQVFDERLDFLPKWFLKLWLEKKKSG